MAADIFMCMSKDYFKIKEGANYGTVDSRCPGAVEVHSFEHKVQQVGSESGGRPRSVEYVDHGEFMITKAVDMRTPLLFQFCCDATYIGEVKVMVYSATGGDWSIAAGRPKPYLTYTMSYVHVNSVAPAGGSGVPMETIGLRYGQMKVKWEQGGIALQSGHQESGLDREWSLVMQIPQGIAGGLAQGDAQGDVTWPPPPPAP